METITGEILHHLTLQYGTMDVLRSGSFHAPSDDEAEDGDEQALGDEGSSARAAVQPRYHPLVNSFNNSFVPVSPTKKQKLNVFVVTTGSGYSGEMVAIVLAAQFPTAKVKVRPGAAFRQPERQAAVPLADTPDSPPTCGGCRPSFVGQPPNVVVILQPPLVDQSTASVNGQPLSVTTGFYAEGNRENRIRCCGQPRPPRLPPRPDLHASVAPQPAVCREGGAAVCRRRPGAATPPADSLRGPGQGPPARARALPVREGGPRAWRADRRGHTAPATFATRRPTPHGGGRRDGVLTDHRSARAAVGGGSQ